MSSYLTKKEELAKEIMFEHFIPVLHRTLENGNREKYATWNGNACRQSAILGVKILEILLPEYEWLVYDGQFQDIVLGNQCKYNHAWIFGVHKEEDRKLLVDLARKYQEQLFIVTERNSYPSWHEEYKDTIILRSEEMDVEKRLREKEFYTGIYGYRLLKIIIDEMAKRMPTAKRETRDIIRALKKIV